MKTQDSRWTRIRDLFSQAVDLTPEQRERFLDNHCSGDEELRSELNALLDSDAGHSISPITGAIGAAVEATTREHRKELLGSVIGPYRLTSVIGHGGAGTVYLGERVDRQYSAQVAIKIVESAALHAEIGRRFRSERQILANLNHPRIARLLDAGETEQGYPYLVMEYVHGEPIDVYCDKNKLDLEARIKLLLQVCEAVRYAHQNLVVHRDIKPANILVGPDGNPKLLDFGIAKLLDTGALAADLALTRMNDRVLTPEYASPEQILGNSVTTATDVYSLGVVLFELLTGLRPYKVSAGNQLELERTICVTDPTTPSTAVKQALRAIGSDPPPTRNIHAIADARDLTPMRLRTRLEGDLDSIILRSLRKELTYRYTTIDQFAGDLQAYLAREPVAARQGNWFYYAQRFTRKHAFGVSVTAGFIVVLTAALITTMYQAKQIAQERDVANREKQTSEAVATFMSDVFGQADPFVTQGRKEATARELLDNATRDIQSNLTQEPAVKARLLETLGNTYRRQGQSERSIPLIEQAIELREKLEGKNNPAIASLLISLGRAQLENKDFESAERTLHRAMDFLSQTKRTRDPEYAEALLRLAIVEELRSNLPQSFSLFEQAIPLYREIHGKNNAETAVALLAFANAKLWGSDALTAERLEREAVDIYRASTPELHPDRMMAEYQLGQTLLIQGRLNEAAPLLETAYHNYLRVYGEHSEALVGPIKSLVEVQQRNGNFENAEQLARSALALTTSLLGGKNLEVAHSKVTLAIILWKRNSLREAEQNLRSALEIYREKVPLDHLYVAACEHFLSEVLVSLKRPAEAITQLTATISRLKRLNASEWRLARSENTLGEAYLELGQLADARQYLERSYQILSTSSGDVPPDTVRLARERLLRLYTRTGSTKKLVAMHGTG